MDSTINYRSREESPSDILGKIATALECSKKWGCACQTRHSDHLNTHCPAHEDEKPSLSVKVRDDGVILVQCHAGCTQQEVVAAFRDRGLWPKAKRPAGRPKGGGRGKASVGKRRDSVTPSVGRSLVRVTGDPGGSTPPPPGAPAPGTNDPGLTLEALAAAKKLQVALLEEWGCSTIYRGKIPAVRIPYRDEAGNLLATRFRVNLEGRRFEWKSGDHPHLYGLDRLEEIRRAGYVLLVEGESDVWTASYYEIPALGIPGKATWKSEWAKHLVGLKEVILWQEPGAEDLADRVARDVPNLRIVEVAPPSPKDISDAHIADAGVPGLVRELRRAAVAGADRLRERQEARVEDLRRRAEPILSADDPLALVETALAVGYAGDVWRPTVIYLAATSRLLALERGQIPVHLIILAGSSTGKNYTLDTATRLLPSDVIHEIDAGSPRVLIYGDFETRHGVVVFGESDSLPAGEDNPAASAIRSLLAKNTMKYEVVEKDPATGSSIVREIVREGPTVLLTTSTHHLGGQLMTRLFELDVPDDPAYIRQVLKMQAQIECDGIAPPDPALVAYQQYLQELAPWDVVVPFAEALALALGTDIVLQPRLQRDHARILSFIKSITILRHVRRQKDATTERLVATEDDYAAAYRLLNPVYAATATGVNEGVRRVVEAVTALGKDGVQRITPAEIARKLKMHKQTVGRHVRTALWGDYLKNRSDKERQYDLVGGNPLPDKTAGLPTVERLRELIADPSKATPKEAPDVDEDEEGFITLKGEGGASSTGQGRDSVTPPVTAVTQSPASPAGKDPLPPTGSIEEMLGDINAPVVGTQAPPDEDVFDDDPDENDPEAGPETPGVEATAATAPSPRQKKTQVPRRGGAKRPRRAKARGTKQHRPRAKRPRGRRPIDRPRKTKSASDGRSASDGEPFEATSDEDFDRRMRDIG